MKSSTALLADAVEVSSQAVQVSSPDSWTERLLTGEFRDTGHMGAGVCVNSWLGIPAAAGFTQRLRGILTDQGPQAK